MEGRHARAGLLHRSHVQHSRTVVSSASERDFLGGHSSWSVQKTGKKQRNGKYKTGVMKRDAGGNQKKAQGESEVG